MKLKLHSLLSAVVFTLGNGIVCILPSLAQVTTDGTTSTTVTPNDTGVQIENGDRSGGNLFHSFDEFSVPTNSEAYFNNASDIVNIFSRVTGGNVSNIDGTLRANGAANLFLINPAGIVFGENARLQLGGSFYGSTADSIIFPDGEFSATDLENPPLITVNAPIGLGFRDNPNSITVRGNGEGVRTVESEVIDTQEALRIGTDNTIGLIGGELIFDDATIKTAGGSIELGSVAGGEVDLVAVANGFTFDYSRIENFSDISLTGRSVIDASGLGSGEINVTGNNISIADISGLVSHTLGSTPGKNINVLAAESLTISGVANEFDFLSAISSRTFPQGTADAGNIKIETGSLVMGDRSLIGTFVSGEGNAGEIDINARESVSLTSEGNTTAIASSIGTGAIGNGGNINITTPSLTLNNGAFLTSNTSGQGNAGNIVINASDTVALNDNGNFTGFFTNVRTPEVVGNGGDISITTSSLKMNNGATLNSSTSGQGNAGNVTLNVSESIALEGNPNSLAYITTNVNSSGLGDGGNIDITTGSLTVTSNASLRSITSGTGNGGNISVSARNSISFEGQGQTNGIFTAATSGANGNAGNINLSADSLNFNDASLQASSFSQNNGGNIQIEAQNSVSFQQNSEIFASGANGGAVTIDAKSLEITSGSRLFAGVNVNSGSSEAQAGDITINLIEDLLLDGAGSGNPTNISNQNFGTGNAGNVFINARNLDFRNGGNIFNANGGAGNLGDVKIVATGDISVDGIKGFSNSGIANFVNLDATGDVGKIEITAQNLSITNGGQIQSSVAGTANSGDINLNIADTILIDGSGQTTTSDGTNATFASSIFSEVSQPGNGNSGDINVQTQNLFLLSNGSISASIFGTGNGGDININADVINIGEPGNTSISPSSIASEAISGILNSPILEANAGDITINTRSLSISDGGDVDVGASGIGNGGNITINATESITVKGTGFINDAEVISSIDASTFLDSIGRGGNIKLTTSQLSVTNLAEVRAITRGEGNAGSIDIVANDSVNLAATGFIRTEVREGATGDGGDIAIATNSLTLQDKSLIGAEVRQNAVGNGGNISVDTRSLNLTEGSQISVSTSGKGNAGSLEINALDSISFSGTQEQTRGGLLANALVDNGMGGDILVTTDKLTISDGATITVSNFSSLGFTEPGTGEAGNLRVEANSMTLSNEARIDTATRSGNGGNATFEIADTLTLRENSFISARALNNASGGNITIDTNFIIAFPSRFDGNDIRADAEQGRGGRINITAESVLGIAERKLNPLTNDINASSQVAGLEGTISINTPDINPLRTKPELPNNPIPNNIVATNACNVSIARESSSLIVKGKGGLIPQIIRPLTTDNLIIDEQQTVFNSPDSDRYQENRWQGNQISSEIQPAIDTKEMGAIYAARGILKEEDGTIYLTAYQTSEKTRPLVDGSFACGS